MALKPLDIGTALTFAVVTFTETTRTELHTTIVANPAFAAHALTSAIRRLVSETTFCPLFVALWRITRRLFAKFALPFAWTLFTFASVKIATSSVLALASACL